MTVWALSCTIAPTNQNAPLFTVNNDGVDALVYNSASQSECAITRSKQCGCSVRALTVLRLMTTVRAALVQMRT